MISALLLSIGGNMGIIGRILICAVSVLFLMPLIGGLMILGGLGFGIMSILAVASARGMAMIGMGIGLIIAAFGLLILYLGIYMLKNVTPKVLRDISTFFGKLFAPRDNQ